MSVLPLLRPAEPRSRRRSPLRDSTARYRERPVAAALAALSVTLGVAITLLAVGLHAEFTGGIYRNQVDYLAQSFSITKAQPHGTRVTGVESLHDSDVDALRESLDPSVVAHVIPIAQGRAVLHRGPQGFSGGVIGGSEDYLSYLHTPLLKGTMFTADQVSGSARVILLGPGVVKALFPQDPDAALGSQIRVGRLMFTVIGLVGKDATGGNSSVSIAPVTTVRGSLLGGIRTVGAIGVVARSATSVASASKQATAILERQRGPLKGGLQNDFSITTFSSDRLALARPLIAGAFWLAVGVAALCFLLGTAGTAGLRRDPTPRTPTTRRRAGLFTGSIRDALACTVVGILLGYLVGQGATMLLAGVAPQVGAPRFVTATTITAALGFGLAVGVCGAAVAAARRGRAESV